MGTVTCFINIGKEHAFHGVRPRVIGYFYENEASTGISIYKKSKSLSGFEYVGKFLPERKTTEDPVKLNNSLNHSLKNIHINKPLRGLKN